MRTSSLGDPTEPPKRPKHAFWDVFSSGLSWNNWFSAVIARPYELDTQPVIGIEVNEHGCFSCGCA